MLQLNSVTYSYPAPEQQGLDSEQPSSGLVQPGSADRKPGSAARRPGSTSEQPGSASRQTASPAVDRVSLEVAPGSCLVLLGRNGSGKSTLSRIAKGAIKPSSGTVSVDGINIAEREAWPLVGFVGQDASAQMVSSQVFDEVAFGPRNLGVSQDEVDTRVARALADCNLAGMEQRGVAELSGGQRQRLAVAGALALQPRYLVLDEPFSQLDGTGRAELSQLLSRLVHSGVGILLVTHLAQQAFCADRAAVLSDGKLVWSGAPAKLLQNPAAAQASTAAQASGAAQVPAATQTPGVVQAPATAQTPCLEQTPAATYPSKALDCSGLAADPLVRCARALVPAGYDVASFGLDPHAMARFAQDSGQTDAIRQILSVTPATAGVAELNMAEHSGSDLVVSHASVQFGEVGSSGAVTVALDDVSVRLRAGTVTLVAGRTGSGKSTLARVMAGVLEPQMGDVALQAGTDAAESEPVQPGMVGLAFQRPEDQLFCSTVLEDVAFGPKNRLDAMDQPDPKLAADSAEFGGEKNAPANIRVSHPEEPDGGLAQKLAEDSARAALAELGVDESMWQKSPFDLSGGQRRRVALAGIVAMHPGAYVFDEPTAGLDGQARAFLHEVVARLARSGAAVCVVSHDVGEWLPLSDEVVLLKNGKVAYEGAAKKCLANLKPYELAGIEPPARVILAHELGLANELESALANGPSNGLADALAHEDSKPVYASNGVGAGACSSDRHTTAQTGSEGLTSKVAANLGMDSGELDAQPEQSGEPQANPARAQRRRRPQARRRPQTMVALPVGAYVARQTAGPKLDARVKLALVLALTVASFASSSLLWLAALVAGVIVCQRMVGVSARSLARALRPAVIVLAFALVANSFVADGTADLLLIGSFGIRWAGVARGVMAVARIVTIVGAVLAMAATTTGPLVAQAISQVVSPLSGLGVPVDDLGMILSVALRFLPESVSEFDTIHTAQRARGARFDQGSISHRLSRWVSVLVPMVVALFRRSDQLAEAMRCRCYGWGPRTLPRSSMNRADVLALLVAVALVVVSFLL